MSMDWKANDRRGEAPQGEKSRISAALIIWIVVAILAVVFIAQNARDAQVKFLFWDGTLSLWVVIVLTLIAGALLDRLVMWIMRRRKAKREAA